MTEEERFAEARKEAGKLIDELETLFLPLVPLVLRVVVGAMLNRARRIVALTLGAGS